MKGNGKRCGFELHHPMSFGDFLAALFRRKPKKYAGKAEEVLARGQRRSAAESGLAEDPSYSEAAAELAGAGDGRHD